MDLYKIKSHSVITVGISTEFFWASVGIHRNKYFPGLQPALPGINLPASANGFGITVLIGFSPKVWNKILSGSVLFNRRLKSWELKVNLMEY